jgi:hypothetical protein
MKKTSIISVMLLVLATVIMSFAFRGYSNESGVQSPNSTMPVRVINCPDCTNLWYCLDGGSMVFKGTCEFTIDCKEGKHTIYVYCNGPDGGCSTATFSCFDRAVIVDCSAVSLNCPCTDKKKK